MEVWRFIYDKLNASQNVLLLWVLHSEGSSPGRKGFKLAVAEDGSFYGTIGGGIMEHKLVEKAKAALGVKNEENISLIKQYHDKKHNREQSGMICSGSQVIASVPLSEKNMSSLKNIVASANNKMAVVQLSPAGLIIREGQQEAFLYKTETDWTYSEAIDARPVIHIIGGGHVGVALAELMLFLGFYIHLYDNRPGLKTIDANCFAHEKHVVDYQTIGYTIKASPDDYVVIVTFGYRDDKTVLKQLLDKKFFYLGMMGSDSKIKTLFRELEEEGIAPERWALCFAPIGINIHSQTAKEIAVSIAAEIIREKNKGLPAGRSNPTV